MKHFLSLVLPMVFLFEMAWSATITVSNNPKSPAQYNNVQAAIDAAADGDTILVSGSPTLYPNFTVSKRLWLIGQGYAPVKEMNNSCKVDGLVIATGGSSATISGFRVSYLTLSGPVQEVSLLRNQITSGVTAGSRFIVSENLIQGYLGVEGNDVLVRNNFFIGYISASIAIQGLIVVNNVFSNATAFSFRIANALIANNIFYPKANTPSSAAILDVGNAYSNNTLNNNIYFNNNNANPFSIGLFNNSGMGNINIDPQFVSYDLASIFLTEFDNLKLKPGSPALLGGTDGKDIGMYGGLKPAQFPLTGEPSIPRITAMSISNAVIPVDGTIQVKVKANSGN